MRDLYLTELGKQMLFPEYQFCTWLTKMLTNKYCMHLLYLLWDRFLVIHTNVHANTISIIWRRINHCHLYWNYENIKTTILIPWSFHKTRSSYANLSPTAGFVHILPNNGFFLGVVHRQDQREIRICIHSFLDIDQIGKN